MSSQLNLARKYRPTTLSELRGQTQAVKLLSEALKNDRVGPAYLFSGPRGVGKTSAARIFAKAASCSEIKSAPCGKCDSCLAIQSGHALHLIEIDGASHTGVDDVRALIEAANYRPATGRRTVYIVDEVHMLSQAAFNALLKTLEEPPRHVLFIFATTELQKIPETILSRVQRVELKRISEAEITSSLKDIAKLEGVKASDEVLSQIAAAADGAFRDAQTLFEQVLILSGSKEASPEVADQLLGTIGTSQEIKILEFLARNETDKLLQSAKEFYDRGKDLEKILNKLVIWVRALIAKKAAPGYVAIDEEYPPEFLNIAIQAFKNWSDSDLDRLFECLWSGYERMKRSDLPLVTLETTLIRASRLPRTRDLQTLIQQLENVRLEAPAKQDTPKAPSFEPTAKPSIENNFSYNPSKKAPTRLPEFEPMEGMPPAPLASKEELLQALRKLKPSLFPLLNSAVQSDWKGSKLSLHFPEGHFALQQLSEATFKKEVETQLTKIVGRPQQMELITTEKSQAPAAPKERGDFMKEAKTKAVTDPNVAKAAELLNGKVTSVTIEGVKT